MPHGHTAFVATFHARRLPHYYALGNPIFLTWRLYGSLPANRVFPAPLTSGLLDGARTGPLYLGRPDIANMVVDALHFRERELAHDLLHEWVVMTNHVHMLITPRVEVSKLMQSLKRFTARGGNRLLGLTGRPFWQDESFDRLVRDEDEVRRIARYIEMNPVSAGLAETPEAFPWSSTRAD